MANYAVPPTLFPHQELVTRWSCERSWSPFEQKIRKNALAGFVTTALPDKELQRFMVPNLEWSVVEPVPPRSLVTQLGPQSWYANAGSAPFIPPACYDLIDTIYKEPRSVAHLLGATFTHVSIVYLADSLPEVIVPPASARELIFVVVEPNISVTLSEGMTPKEGIAARSLLGSIAYGSQVTMLSDQHNENAQVIQHDRWHIAKEASLLLTEVATGGTQSWLRKEFILEDQAQLDYTWLAALQNDEQAALTTVQTHKGPSSSSSVTVKTALLDTARSFYRGTIAISGDASKSEANQQQRALLLSPHTRTCAIPSLEVATHDVQCAHGSAAGKFDAEEIQYLLSRGLDEQHAEKLLLEGFFSLPVLQDAPNVLNRLKNSIRRAKKTQGF